MVTYSRNVLSSPISSARDAALPFQVLRLQPDAGERKNFIFLAQLRVAVNDHVRMQFAFVAQHDVFADDAIRTDFAARRRFAPSDEQWPKDER